jgi:hypothetical protein
MPRYRLREGERLSHSVPVEVEGPSMPMSPPELEARKGVPRLAKQWSYEDHLLDEGDEVELPEADGKRLVDAGVLEGSAKKSRGRKK